MALVFSGNRYNQHPFMVKKTYKDHNALRHTVLINPPAGGWCWVVLGFGSESVLTVWQPSCNKKDVCQLNRTLKYISDNILIIIQQTGLWFIFVQHPTTHFVSVVARMQNMDQQSLDDTTGRTSSRWRVVFHHLAFVRKEWVALCADNMTDQIHVVSIN